MKTLLFFCLCLAGQLVAQTTTVAPTGVKLTPGVQPPSVVLSRFAAGYPNINPVWTLNEDIYSAEYRVEDTNMGRMVNYDREGNLLSIDNELHNDAYPASIGKYYIKKYPHEKYAIWLHEEAAGGKSYFAPRAEGRVWFDAGGKPVDNTKTVKKKSRKKVT